MSPFRERLLTHTCGPARDELLLVRGCWDRTSESKSADEPAAVASLWRALINRLLRAKDLGATWAWRSRELVPTEASDAATRLPC